MSEFLTVSHNGVIGEVIYCDETKNYKARCRYHQKGVVHNLQTKGIIGNIEDLKQAWKKTVNEFKGEKIG